MEAKNSDGRIGDSGTIYLILLVRPNVRYHTKAMATHYLHANEDEERLEL